jgi:hypothetical protein
MGGECHEETERHRALAVRAGWHDRAALLGVAGGCRRTAASVHVYTYTDEYLHADTDHRDADAYFHADSFSHAYRYTHADSFSYTHADKHVHADAGDRDADAGGYPAASTSSDG